MPLPDLPHGPVPIETGTVELVRVPGDPTGVTVLVNGAESSHLDLADPARLEFEYMQQMVEVLESVIPSPTPVRALHLGGAGCALPRAIEARRPGSRQVAVELDGTLARAVRTWFDLPRAPRLRLRVQDARAAVGQARPGTFDAVVRDVFSGPEVPPHVRTVEFVRMVSAALRPTGVYLVNCIDAPPLHASRREAATVAAVFGHAALMTEAAILKGRRYGNVVLAGSHRPLDVAPLARALRSLPLPVTLVTGAALVDFVGTATPFLDPPGPVPASTDALPAVHGSPSCTTRGSAPCGAEPLAEY